LSGNDQDANRRRAASGAESESGDIGGQAHGNHPSRREQWLREAGEVLLRLHDREMSVQHAQVRLSPGSASLRIMILALKPIL